MSALRQFDLGPGSSPLDVAAGNGDLGILPAHAGADVTAVDASTTVIKHVDKRAAHSEGLDIEVSVIDGVHFDFKWLALGAIDEAEFRAFIEIGGLPEVGFTSEQVERDGEFTVVNVGIGARQ